MPRTPPSGPHFQIEINGKTYGGNLTQSVWDAILEGQRDAEVNIGSLVSGVNEATIKANSAQVTAEAAKQDATDLAAATTAFSASVNPRYTAGVNLTNAVTVTPIGGVPPYFHSWSYVSGDTFTVTDPTSATTQFQSFTQADGVYRDTVTDSTPGTPLTTSVNVGVSVAFVVE